MAFLYNSAKKKFLFAPRETPPSQPGVPPESAFGLISTGSPGATDCCCCPCCQVLDGAQTYTCTNDTRKATCSGGGGTPKCNHATCQADTCCNGACCQGESCSITADVVCQQLGGTFKGCGTTCEAGICDEPCSGPCDAENPCPEGCVCVDGECVGVPPCQFCEEQLQAVYEIDGLEGDCACLNGTYVADMNAFTDLAGYGISGPTESYGGKLFVLDGCSVGDQTAYVSIGWACDYSFVGADAGFTVLPEKGNDSYLPLGSIVIFRTASQCSSAGSSDMQLNSPLPDECEGNPTAALSFQPINPLP